MINSTLSKSVTYKPDIPKSEIKLTHDEICKIANNASLILRCQLTQDQLEKISSQNNEKYYYKYIIYPEDQKNPPILTFISEDTDQLLIGRYSGYSINLKTLKPTSNSSIKTKIPNDIYKKYVVK